MKNLLTLLLLGFAGYGGYTLWNNQRPDAQHEPVQTESALQSPSVAAPPKVGVSASVPEANGVISDIITFTHQNLEQILSPIQAQGTQPTFGQLTQLKVRLLSETRKTHPAQSTARLQLALRLAGTLEQAISQRTEHVRTLHASEYAEGIEGTSSASKKNFQLSNVEERRRLDRTEWWKRGTERKWDDIAVQYRAAVEKLLVSLAG